MKFLENYGLTPTETEKIVSNIPMIVATSLNMQKRLVERNVKFLKELGLNNIFAIFYQYYDMFLMDNSQFEEIFNKYDRDDLVDKIIKNVAIIEYL